MADTVVLKPSDCNQLYDVSSGAIRFKVKCPFRIIPLLTLYSSKIPCEEYYKVLIGEKIKILDYKGKCITTFDLVDINFEDFQEFWITWHDDLLMLGRGEQSTPLFTVNIDVERHIGFVQFGKMQGQIDPVEWIIDKSPVNLKQTRQKRIIGGDLHWVKMTINDHLPQDAMIGGFESEPLYIARANHNNSLCPGKFQPFRKKVYVPWGHREHSKEEFEVLCGFDAHWVSTRSNYIPENAVIAGYSEVRQEPLYVGRAMHDGYLLIGKVHTLYSTCYLPYKGHEIQVATYEILVKGDSSQIRAVLGQ